MDWLLDAANWFGSAVCHQWDAHSYVIGGVPLCLCARCTGMYLGGLMTLAFLAIRSPRAVKPPRVPFVIAMLVFFLLWAGDGVNSLASAILGRPFLYEPQNLLRLITGTLMGISFGSLAFLMLNGNLYRVYEAKPIYENPVDFFVLLALGGGVVAVVNSQAAFLLYPLSALMLVAVVGLNATIMTALVASFGREVTRWGELGRRVAWGVAMAVVVLSGIAGLRVMAGI